MNMQQLEQISRSYQESSRENESHSYGRLELYSLGVSRLYSSILGGIGGEFNGGIGGESGRSGFERESIFDRMDRFAGSSPLTPMSSRHLTIRDSPSSELQLHIHEGIGGSAKLKMYDGLSKGISSYDAAILDLYGDRLKIKKIELKKKSEPYDSEGYMWFSK